MSKMKLKEVKELVQNYMIPNREVWIQSQTELMPVSKPLDYKLRKRKKNEVYSQEFEKLR